MASQGSNYKGNKSFGCPIQAVLWLEWATMPSPTRLSLSLGDLTFLIFEFLAHPTGRFSKTPTSRHPERSASQIYRLTKVFGRAVEGPRGYLLADALQSFPATKT